MKGRNGMIALALAAAGLLVLLCAAYSASAGERARVSPAMTAPTPEATQPPVTTEESEAVPAPVFHEIPTATDAENDDGSTEDTANTAAESGTSACNDTAASAPADSGNAAESSSNTESSPADDEPAAVEPEPADVILENGEPAEAVECTGPATEAEPEPEDEYIVTETGEIIVVCH